MIEYRPASGDDVFRYFGRTFEHRIRAFLIVRDDEVVAFVGLVYEGKKNVLFSDIKEGVSASPIAIFRAAAQAVAILRCFATTTIIAHRDSDLSGRFLRMLGFRAYTIDPNTGGTWFYLNKENP